MSAYIYTYISIYLFIYYGLTSSSDSKDHYSGRRDGEQDIIKLCSSHHPFPPPFVINGPNDPIWQTLKDPVTGSLQSQKLSCSYEQGPKPVRTYLLRHQSAQLQVKLYLYQQYMLGRFCVQNSPFPAV